LLHVEYKDPFFRIGYLEEALKILPEREAWLGPKPPTSLKEISLDVTVLGERLRQAEGKIERVRLWADPHLALEGMIEAERCSWPAA